MNSQGACVLFDGYPRNREQADQLDRIFDELGMKLSGVIAIMVDPEALITRITSRRTCGACGTIINLALNPVENTHKCPNCGGELVHRSDDNEATVRRRIDEYHSQSEPLLDHYKSRQLLHPVEGLGTVKEVQSRIASVLDKLGGVPPCHDSVSGSSGPSAGQDNP